MKSENSSIPQLSFLEYLNNLYPAPPIRFEYRNDEWHFYFFEQSEEYAWILAIILFAMIIYAFTIELRQSDGTVCRQKKVDFFRCKLSEF